MPSRRGTGIKYKKANLATKYIWNQILKLKPIESKQRIKKSEIPMKHT